MSSYEQERLAALRAHQRRLEVGERLRPWALSGATRAAMKQRPGALDELADRLRAT